MGLQRFFNCLSFCFATPPLITVSPGFLESSDELMSIKFFSNKVDHMSKKWYHNAFMIILSEILIKYTVIFVTFSRKVLQQKAAFVSDVLITLM